MLIRTLNQKATERKGVILLVVISLLTLFAIVALSFLLYANAEANASKLFREEKGNIPSGPDPEKLFNFFLRQFIYDVPDDSTGVYSSLRGTSLARSIYGLSFVDLPANLTAGSPAVTLTNASYSLSPGINVFGPGILPNTTV